MEYISIHSKGQNLHALVDNEDYDLVSKYTWQLSTNGYAMTTPYVNKKRISIRMHRLIMGLERGDKREIDHKDHNRLNNQRYNLRIGTHAENGQNRQSYPNTSSKYRNVYWRQKDKHWVVNAQLNGKTMHIGYFENEELANLAAIEWRKVNMPFALN